MKNRLKILAAASIVLILGFAPFTTANAVVIYEVTTDLGFQGHVSFADESVITDNQDAFGRVFGNFFDDWEFTFGGLTFSPGTGQALAGAANTNWLMFDASLDVIMWNICVITGSPGDLCSVSNSPVFLFRQWDAPPFMSDSTILNVFNEEAEAVLGASNRERINAQWTSIPEPGTLALLGVALVALGFVGRRKATI